MHTIFCQNNKLLFFMVTTAPYSFPDALPAMPIINSDQSAFHSSHTVSSVTLVPLFLVSALTDSSERCVKRAYVPCSSYLFKIWHFLTIQSQSWISIHLLCCQTCFGVYTSPNTLSFLSKAKMIPNRVRRMEIVIDNAWDSAASPELA